MLVLGRAFPLSFTGRLGVCSLNSPQFRHANLASLLSLILCLTINTNGHVRPAPTMPPKGSSKRGKRPQQAQTDSSSPSEDQLPLRKTSRKEATTPLQRYHDGDLKDDGTSEDELGHASEEETIRTAVKPAPSPRVIINVASGDTANELETDNLTAAEKPSIKVMQQPTKGMKRARFSPTKYSGKYFLVLGQRCRADTSSS